MKVLENLEVVEEDGEFLDVVIPPWVKSRGG